MGVAPLTSTMILCTCDWTLLLNGSTLFAKCLTCLALDQEQHLQWGDLLFHITQRMLLGLVDPFHVIHHDGQKNSLRLTIRRDYEFTMSASLIWVPMLKKTWYLLNIRLEVDVLLLYTKLQPRDSTHIVQHGNSKDTLLRRTAGTVPLGRMSHYLLRIGKAVMPRLAPKPVD